jgi:hypothetical protein
LSLVSFFCGKLAAAPFGAFATKSANRRHRKSLLKTKVSDPVVLPNERKLGLYALAGMDGRLLLAIDSLLARPEARLQYLPD